MQVIPSAELPHLIARSDATCALVVLASDDQAVRQRKPLKQTREYVRQMSVLTEEMATAVDWRRLSTVSEWKVRVGYKSGHAEDKGLGEQLVEPEENTAAKESELPAITDDPKSTKRCRIRGETTRQVEDAANTPAPTTQVADAPRSPHAPERPQLRSLGPSCRPVVHRAW